MQMSERMIDHEKYFGEKIELKGKSMEDMLEMKFNSVEKDLNMIAMNHIQDFQSIKGVAKEFVLSKDKLK